MLKARLKRRVFSSFLKTQMSGSAQMYLEIEFHAVRPACEDAHSPNLVRSCGSDWAVSRWRWPQTLTEVWSAGIKRLHIGGGDMLDICHRSE